MQRFFLEDGCRRISKRLEVSADLSFVPEDVSHSVRKEKKKEKKKKKERRRRRRRKFTYQVSDSTC